MRPGLLAAILFSSTCLAYSPNRPDPELTPGAIYKNATKEDVCKPGYARHVRHVSAVTKRKVFARYEIKDHHGMVIDHLIPLCLSGSNSVLNLWPETLQVSYEDDVLERQLCHDVCAGKIDLETARTRITEWKRRDEARP